MAFDVSMSLGQVRRVSRVFRSELWRQSRFHWGCLSKDLVPHQHRRECHGNWAIRQGDHEASKTEFYSLALVHDKKIIIMFMGGASCRFWGHHFVNNVA